MSIMIKKLKNTGEHYHILQYAMDRYATRNIVDRWDTKGGSWEQGVCQVCWIRKGKKLRQTKEHMWSGECEGTKEVMQGLQFAMKDTCERGNNTHIFKEIWPIIISMIEKVDT